MAQVAELVTKFSFAGSLKPLDNLNAGLTSAVGTIAKVSTAFTAGAVALNGFLVASLQSTDAQLQLSKEIGVSVEELQTLGYVASVNGSSAEAMTKSLEGLATKIGEASVQGSEDFSRLGISVRDSMGNVKNSSDVLLEVRDRFKEMGLSAEQQKAYMEKLGIDPTLLQTLNLSADAMDSLKNKAKALGVVTQEQAQQVANFNDSLTTLKYGMDSIQKQVAIAFAPSLGDLADNFTDLLVSNKDMIQNGLKKFFELVNTGLGAIFRFGKLLYNLIDNTVGLENALMIAGGAMLYLNRAMIMNPIGAIIAGIVGLIVVVDDLMTGLEGGQSAIADFFQEFLGIDILPFIQEIKNHIMSIVGVVGATFDLIVTTVKSSFGMVANLFKLLTGQISFSQFFDETVAIFNGLLEPIKKVFDAILKFFQPVLDAIGLVTNFKMPSVGDIAGGVTDAVGNVVGNVADTVGNTVSDVADSVGSFFSNLNPFSSKKKPSSDETENLPSSKSGKYFKHEGGYVDYKDYQASQMASKTITPVVTSSSSTQNNNNIKIEVKTDNPTLAGQSVTDELNAQLRSANSNFNRNVAR